MTRHLVEDPWAEQAPSWDSDPVVRAYADAAWSSLRAHGEPRAGARVLDFGCGTGLLSERMAPHVAEVIAVDASPAMVAVLSEKRIPNVRAGVASWTPATIDRDDLARGPFDLVVCSSVCAFLDDYPGTVAMLARRLAPGGVFVQWDWELDPLAAEPFGLTTSGVRSALEGAVLDVVSVGTGFDVAIEGGSMRPLMGVGRRRP
ncbi:MAG: class I SAM-dependent methyltransferase [Myxococcales bacterium]|nr:class I SAM-dependent methyltransferase [Myxococcales bacterium]